MAWDYNHFESRQGNSNRYDGSQCKEFIASSDCAVMSAILSDQKGYSLSIYVFSAVQCSAVQCSAVTYSVQCSAVQCSAVQYNAVQSSAVQCSAV